MTVKIKKVRHGWILYNDKLGYEAHSHFKNESAARACMSLINKGIYPSQPYFKETCKRVLSSKELERLKGRRKKDKYINSKKFRK